MNKENIKTLVIALTVLIVVIGGTFVVSQLTNDSYGLAFEERIPEDEQKELTLIGIDDYLNLKAGSNLAIIYIARPTCTFCTKEEPIVKNLVYLYDLQVNYLNTDELDEESFTKLIESDEYFKSGLGTPLILLVKDNKIVDKAPGYHTKSELISFFEKNGFDLN